METISENNTKRHRSTPPAEDNPSISTSPPRKKTVLDPDIPSGESSSMTASNSKNTVEGMTKAVPDGIGIEVAQVTGSSNDEVTSGGGKEESQNDKRKDKRDFSKGKNGKPKIVWEPRQKIEGEVKLPKRKVAVLIGYCGTGYSGMQIQEPGSRTIEGEFFSALVKAGAISLENSDDHKKVDLQRAARTDAGVHAAGNCISIKIIIDPPMPSEYPTLSAYINSFLPPQIRMWGFVRTLKSFQARLACDSRVYEYLLPSYCLLPPASSDPLAKQLDESSPGWRETLEPGSSFSDAGAPALKFTEEGEGIDPKERGEYERRRGWRVDVKTLERFRALIQMFKGTRNFHNYTVGKPFNDKTVKRFMISLTVKDPVVYGEIEWISVQIHGQSFMLHQIRKMLSMAMLACRTATPPTIITETFNNKRIHIPKAPPLGLLLQQPQFNTYNQRIQGNPGGLTEDRDPIDFDKYREVMDKFKIKFIYERLREEELESSVFHKWIRQMDCTASNMLTFLNTKGIIPPEAQLTLDQGKKLGSGSGKKPSAEGGDGGKASGGEAGLEGEGSDDEEVDLKLLKAGELDG